MTRFGPLPRPCAALVCALLTACGGSSSSPDPVCPPEQTLCDGKCVDPGTDRHHCGGCAGAGGEACPAAADCIEGTCQGSCPSPLTSCLSSEETPYCADTRSDPGNCGACGGEQASAVCGAETGAVPVCIQGACAELCQAGFADCDGDLGSAGNGCETDAQNDPQNCGGCGTLDGSRVCVTSDSHAVPACRDGSCAASCEPMRGDCNGDLGTGGDGCEVDLSSSADHCGACGSPCLMDCCRGSCLTPCPEGTFRNAATCQCGESCDGYLSRRMQVASNGKALDYTTHWNDAFYYPDAIHQDGSGTGFPWAGFGSGVFAVLNPLIDDVGSPYQLVSWTQVRIWVVRASEFVRGPGCKYDVAGKDVSSANGTPDLITVQRTCSCGAGSLLVWQAPLVDRRPGAAPIAEGEELVVVVQRPNADGSFDDVIDPARDIIDGELNEAGTGWVGFRVVNVQ